MQNTLKELPKPADGERSVPEHLNPNPVISIGPEGVSTGVQELQNNIEPSTEIVNSEMEGFLLAAIETSVQGNTEEQGEERRDDSGDPVARDTRLLPVHHQRGASTLRVPEKIPEEGGGNNVKDEEGAPLSLRRSKRERTSTRRYSALEWTYYSDGGCSTSARTNVWLL